MRTYNLYQVDAFTDTLFTGNPAGVVYPADGLSEREMQAIAREMNVSETAFIFAPDADDHDVLLRYFTPATEVPICGHATIAAHFVRATVENLPATTIHQKTRVGILPLEIVRSGGAIQIVMTQGAIEFEEPFGDARRAEILHALSLTPDNQRPDCPVQVASTGHSKVMVGIRDVARLADLQPDFAALRRISGEIGCKGYWVFAFDDESGDALTAGRMFAPAVGINEDPVTGNANGPLGAYLVHHGLVEVGDQPWYCFKSRQGHHMGRPGVVEVMVQVADGQPQQVKIAGQAVIVFQTELTLP